MMMTSHEQVLRFYNGRGPPLQQITPARVEFLSRRYHGLVSDHRTSSVESRAHIQNGAAERDFPSLADHGDDHGTHDRPVQPAIMETDPSSPSALIKSPYSAKFKRALQWPEAESRVSTTTRGEKIAGPGDEHRLIVPPYGTSSSIRIPEVELVDGFKRVMASPKILNVTTTTAATAGDDRDDESIRGLGSDSTSTEIIASPVVDGNRGSVFIDRHIARSLNATASLDLNNSSSSAIPDGMNPADSPLYGRAQLYMLFVIAAGVFILAVAKMLIRAYHRITAAAAGSGSGGGGAAREGAEQTA
ncbi:hypothetical protein MBM_04026 [Drepanopeziza brunnea f. sp. 'multigermtubi' MB_m1]|uniref:Uncharacterized protein n=1 Tax=Marssonina brunnea f. sp. multigermtubi (strain MB_m1) TaxID=1072389 RepID=K1WYL8_MARBU|nr:uncharacterized protein MBM_04026 [Drepanopeziza brunnea f. sp. 'multigermtubi' MB_m1]EKD17657.1 hypothetical protein MBM_04026 [Drepanopeziza brunnea f. sp. 'multigermtubi' MB_m1]